MPQILPVGGQEQGRDSGVANVCSTARLSLQEAQTLARSAPSALLPAILPLALVEPYLTALESQGAGHEGEIVDIAPLTRVWRLWSAKILGRV